MEKYIFNDGGRAKAGFKGKTGDCVTRAIAIASGKPYKEIYNVMANGNANQRVSLYYGKSEKIKTARKGISVRRKWFKDYMKSIGFKWQPTMGIGTGCKVHLKADELPKGKIICSVSRHYVAVINGIINDTWDCSRNGTRCVYGYWYI